MYRVGEVCLCEGAASAEEKANGAGEPAKYMSTTQRVKSMDDEPSEGFDLRSAAGNVESG